MLKEITIKNFKSIANDTIELGRVNVFIGENGCGKSNILEAVGFASAAAVSLNIDKETLINKGVRVAKPSLMVSAFKKQLNPEIFLSLDFGHNTPYIVKTSPDNDDIHSARWLNNISSEYTIIENIFLSKLKEEIIQNLSKAAMPESLDVKHFVENLMNNPEFSQKTKDKFLNDIAQALGNQGVVSHQVDIMTLCNYVIYTLNTLNLRGLSRISIKEPGIYGEGLDELLASLDSEELSNIRKYDYLISWLSDFLIDVDDNLKFKGFKLNKSNSILYFSDKYMRGSSNIFSAENANEGILHILFYLAIMISKRTPKFFAIDNIESCLNPHLCRHLMEEICKLAKSQDKQLLITTHNPAILDGLNLFDDEIRLFEVNRTDKGYTKTTRIKVKPEIQSEMGRKYKLSELWTRGFLGTTPDYF